MSEALLAATEFDLMDIGVAILIILGIIALLMFIMRSRGVR
jgi:hypothetical protein